MTLPTTYLEAHPDALVDFGRRMQAFRADLEAQGLGHVLAPPAERQTDELEPLVEALRNVTDRIDELGTSMLGMRLELDTARRQRKATP